MLTYLLIVSSTGLVGSTIYYVLETRRLRQQLAISEEKKHNQSHNQQQEAERLYKEKRTEFDAGYQKGLKEGKIIASAKAEASLVTSYHDGYRAGKKEAENEMSVEVTPFYRSSKIGFPGFKKTVYEFGYEYQLTVKGLPCLDASEKIVGSEKEAEVNREEILSLTQDIIANAIAAKTGLPTNLLHFKKAVEKPSALPA